MTTQDIYKKASELTTQEVINIVKGWENETKSLDTFNSLVRLVDSRELACATVIAKNHNDKGVSEIYRIAYES